MKTAAAREAELAKLKAAREAYQRRLAELAASDQETTK